MNQPDITTTDHCTDRKPLWTSIPTTLKSSPQYQAVRNFVLNHHFDFFLTITFTKPQYDEVAIKSVSHLLNVLNAQITDQRFRKTGRYITGFAFPERHVRSVDKEGSLHFHILGYFPEAFRSKPTIDQLKGFVGQSISKVLGGRGNPIIAEGGVDVREPYVEEGVVNYLSKQLTPDNINKRLLFIGKDGLTGCGPELSCEAGRPKYNFTKQEQRKFYGHSRPARTLLG